MRHLVTGGAGFVGSHLVDRLLAAGDRVDVLDDLSGGRSANLGLPRAGLAFHEGSVLDERLVRALVAGAERVWHLAAVVGVPRVLAAPRVALRVNVRGAENVLDACAAAAVPVVLFSSSEVYGDRGDGVLAESDVLAPGSVDQLRGSYGASKALAEWTAQALVREAGLCCLTVRLFNTVGPRQRAGHGMVLPRFADQALRGGPLTVYGDGSQRRCFADVHDVVDHLLRLAAAPAVPAGATFNLGSTHELSVLELAELVRDAAGTGAEIRCVPFGSAFPAGERDVRRRVPCLERLRAAVGSLPSTPLAETVAAVLATRRAPGPIAAR
jgi:UDP-glucose 4-epimerase